MWKDIPSYSGTHVARPMVLASGHCAGHNTQAAWSRNCIFEIRDRFMTKENMNIAHFELNLRQDERCSNQQNLKFAGKIAIFLINLG